MTAINTKMDLEDSVRSALKAKYPLARFEYQKDPEGNGESIFGLVASDLDETLASIPGALGAWCHDPNIPEWNAFFGAAREALEVELGSTLIQNANVSFRSDVNVTYIGCFDKPDDQFWYYGFLFSLDGRLQVVVGLEEDAIAGHVVYRGDQAAFEEVAFQLKMFKGNVFSHLRDG